MCLPSQLQQEKMCETELRNLAVFLADALLAAAHGSPLYMAYVLLGIGIRDCYNLTIVTHNIKR